MGGPTYRKLSDDCRHDFQYFCVTSASYIAVIVDKDSIEKSRYDVVSDHFEIVGLLDVCFDELEDFLLDGS